MRLTVLLDWTGWLEGRAAITIAAAVVPASFSSSSYSSSSCSRSGRMVGSVGSSGVTVLVCSNSGSVAASTSTVVTSTSSSGPRCFTLLRMLRRNSGRNISLRSGPGRAGRAAVARTDCRTAVAVLRWAGRNVRSREELSVSARLEEYSSTARSLDRISSILFPNFLRVLVWWGPACRVRLGDTEEEKSLDNTAV